MHQLVKKFQFKKQNYKMRTSIFLNIKVIEYAITYLMLKHFRNVFLMELSGIANNRLRLKNEGT